MILNKIISILSSIFTPQFCSVFVYPVFCLAFLATIPAVLRYFIFRK